jgi:hypothetical protein
VDSLVTEAIRAAIIRQPFWSKLLCCKVYNLTGVPTLCNSWPSPRFFVNMVIRRTNPSICKWRMPRKRVMWWTLMTRGWKTRRALNSQVAEKSFSKTTLGSGKPCSSEIWVVPASPLSGTHGYMASGNFFGNVDDHSEGYMKPARCSRRSRIDMLAPEESEYGFGNYMKNWVNVLKSYWVLIGWLAKN